MPFSASLDNLAEIQHHRTKEGAVVPKKLLLSIAAVLTAFGLAACGADGDEQATEHENEHRSHLFGRGHVPEVLVHGFAIRPQQMGVCCLCRRKMPVRAVLAHVVGGTRLPGHLAPRMSPGLRPPPLFRCARRPTILVQQRVLALVALKNVAPQVGGWGAQRSKGGINGQSPLRRT